MLSLHPGHGEASEKIEFDRDQVLDTLVGEMLSMRGDEPVDFMGMPGGFSGLLTCIEEASIHGEYMAMSAMNSDYFIHPTSVVDGPVEIGKDTRIWHFSKLLGPLTIGEGCSLGQNVVVERHVEIGRNVKIQNNVSVYSGVILEDDVFCGPSMVFTNVGTPVVRTLGKDSTSKPVFARVHRLEPTQRSSAGTHLAVTASLVQGRW